MKNIIKTMFMVLCAFCFINSLSAQTPFTTPITIANSDGDSRTLTVGVDPAATYGLDPAFGETELPPMPPDGVFDARFLDLPDRTDHGTGTEIDIRNLVSDTQTDTFKIRFQIGDAPTSDITISWNSDIGTFGGGRWRLTSGLSLTPEIDVDMTKQTSTVVNAENYQTIYVFKSDAVAYRSFGLQTLALDVDNKGKRGKVMRTKSNQVEFCVKVPNTESVPINGLFIQFKTPIDTLSISVDSFATITHDVKQKYNAKTKWTFTNGWVNPGDTVTVCGYGLKDGTKEQGISSWYLTTNGIIQGKKKTQKIGVVFTTNIIRLPMPNIVTALDQMMRQAFPLRTDFLNIGLLDPIHGVKKDTFRYVQHKKYNDVLKTLIKDYGRKGYLLQDSLAGCMTQFDDKRKGFRHGAVIKAKLKTLPPDKHRNRLLGEDLVLKVNILFSQAEYTPAGLGELLINLPESPFNGLTLDSLTKLADEYLTFCQIASVPAATPDEVADLLAMINNAFDATLDTVSWSGSKIVYNGGRPVGDIDFLTRQVGVSPKIIPDLSGQYATVPLVYAVAQNYPNPFNPSTMIEMTLPEEALVTVRVYNMLGQEIAVLTDHEVYEEGVATLQFDARGLASGIYYYRVQMNDVVTGATKFVSTRKMILVK